MDEIKVDLGDEIDLFTKHIDSIGGVLVSLVIALQEVSKKTKESLLKFENEKCEVTETDGERSVKITNDNYKRWRILSRRHEHYELSKSLLPRSLLVSLISQYDAYLGRVLRVIFIKKPEMLNGSERKISFEHLSQFSSIDVAREYILEKEIESILRSSHAEQFKWLESAFKMPLTKDLHSWPAFMELTERRNLFVHTDGVVSSQYLSVCKLHKCALNCSIAEGDRLGVPQKYFESAYECVYEIGVKLGHVLWRKIFPDEREQADTAFQRTSYELIDNGKYRLACNLLDFACEAFKKHSNESHHLILTVNRAQAYKWAGDAEKCRRIMHAIDWSAKGDEFKLADAVLSCNWEKSAKFMKRIGKDGAVTKPEYRDWPLFKEWRKEQLFLQTYREVFEEDFSIKAESKPHNPDEDILNAENIDHYTL